MLIFLGNYGNRNLGDDAILAALSKRYSSTHPAYTQYAFARHYPSDIRRVSRAHPLPASLASAVWALRHADTIVIGGGGIFGASMGPIARYIPAFALLCKVVGKTVIYDSVGVYSAIPPLQKTLLSVSMLTSQSVSVRDRASLRTLSRLAKAKKISLVDDPAYQTMADPPYTVTALMRAQCAQVPFRSRPVIGVSVKRIIGDISASDELAQVIATVTRDLVSTGCYVLYLPFCQDDQKWSEDDAAFAREILQRSGISTADASCLHFYPSPSEMAALLKLVDAAIVMRLHAQIFAYELGVRAAAISYEEKRASFLAEHAMPYLDISDLKPEKLLAMVLNLLETSSTSASGGTIHAEGNIPKEYPRSENGHLSARPRPKCDSSAAIDDVPG